MEILACPICKSPSLELLVFKEDEIEIEMGIIICTECNRYYPIRNTIPIMLPDNMRKKDQEIKFLQKFKEKIPDYILKEGKPFSLSSS